MMPILMDSDSPPVRRQSRGIYLLPNLLTTGCLFAGFYAIVAAIDGNFERAGVAGFIAMIFDGLDGRVARLTSPQTGFGKEYDSLADMVAFGVAPAIVSYQWGVARIAEYGKAWYRFGWLAAFFYAVAAALRLAKFGSRVQDKRYFEGLPSPSAAAVVAAFLWMSSEWREPGLPGLILAFMITAAAGALRLAGGCGVDLHRHRPGAGDRAARHLRRLCAVVAGGVGLAARAALEADGA